MGLFWASFFFNRLLWCFIYAIFYQAHFLEICAFQETVFQKTFFRKILFLRDVVFLLRQQKDVDVKETRRHAKKRFFRTLF